MNKLRKIGLTALAASLVSVSAHAVDMSVTGAGSLSYTNNGTGNGAGSGNNWSSNDTVNFAASGEMDNGWTVSVGYGLDGSAINTAGFEDRTLTLGMGSLGSLAFNAQDGSSVTSALDDRMPTAYEETWFQADGPGNGSGANNMFNYSNTEVDGVNIMISHTPNGGAELDSSTDFGVIYTGTEGVTVGLAMGQDAGAGASAEVDNNVMYATYAMDAFTFGIQKNESDSEVANADEDYIAYAISYAVNDDLSVSYGYSEIDYEGSSELTDKSQEATAVSASYTMGSMAFAITRSDVDNDSGNAAWDGAGYEANVVFSF
jgi:outer membrane protein OmpU